MTSPGFRPTHVVPQRGMPAWETPDPARPTVPLDPLLPVRLVERRGDWAQVLCSNGWSAWVDGRHLVAVPQDPPLPDAPLAGTADPRPLLGRTEQALARYRAAVEDLAAGGLDGETFHRRTRGLRIGVVVDGESVWLYDPARFRWVYGDGSRLSTYAADDPPAAARDDGRDGDRDSDRDGDRDAGPRGGPDADPDVGHAPTRVVTPDGERR